MKATKAKKCVIFLRAAPELHEALERIATGRRPKRSITEEAVFALEEHVEAERKKGTR